MTHIPPPAEELRLLDAELWQLDARRAQLLARRAWLVAALHQARPTPVAPPRPEAPAPRVQNVLLLLGGVLLTIAAMVFTLVSWGHLGIAGRAVVLGAVTLAALAAPVPLLKRGLRSTAESVAGLGLALTVLDAYALHEVALAGADGTVYAAVASAVLAVLWAAYGLLPATSDLRLPRPAALASAQLPLLLWSVAADALPYGVTAALLVTAAFDTAVVLRVTAGSVRVTATVGAYVMGAWGVLAAGWLSWTATGPSAAARAAALLLLGAAIALGAAWRGGRTTVRVSHDTEGPGDTEGPDGADGHGVAEGRGDERGHGGKSALGLAVTAGLLTVAAFGGLVRPMLPEAWTVPVHLACGIALLAALRTERLPDAVRHGFAWASGTVQALALLWALPMVGLAVLGPVGWAERAWTGTPSDARAAVTLDAPWPQHAETVPIVLAAVAAVLVLAVRDGVRRPRALCGALVLTWATVFVLPAVLELPYALGLLGYGGTTAAALAVAAAVSGGTPAQKGTADGASTSPAHEGTPSGAPASPAPEGISPAASIGIAPTAPPRTPSRTLAATAARHFPPTRITALVLALLTSLSLAFLSLASQSSTLTVLSASTALFAAASWKSRLMPATAPAALAYAAALACATGAAMDRQPSHTALLVLAVTVAAALLAARLGSSPATLPVETTGAAAGLLAVGLAVTDPPLLALTLALGGVIAAGTAIRPDRRQVGYAAAALFVLATWVRLAAWDVGTPEAYTLPVTVPALLVGALRRRRDPLASSWTAYGPGLAGTLLPSLVAAWGDAHGTRPLLLGIAALLVTLMGARHHLQAPLLLGGSVLTLNALHELAPYLVQVTDALPRWVPPALVGLLLLALGATYEQRIRNVRRVREVLGRMN